MPLTNLLPWLLTGIAASIAAMVSGVAAAMPGLSWAGAGLFCAALVAVAIDVNRPWWSQAGSAEDHDLAISAAIRNARLMILGYLWGSLALFSIYRLSGLRWHHGIQYAVGMAAIAWLILLYVHLVARPGSSLRTPKALHLATRASLAHGAAALAGIAFLLLSGKIHSIKGDWAANQVFLAGGIAVVALSLIGAYTQFRLGVLKRGGAEPGFGAPSN
jgi:hypothetical protein